MKRPIITFFILLLACLTASAQQSELCKAVASHFQGLNSFTATVKLTRHNAAVTNDNVTKGTYYWKRPNQQSMIFPDTKEMLLASSTAYTMVKGGKQRTVKAKAMGNNPFEILTDIFTHMASGDTKTLTTQANVSVARQGSSYLLTVTPKAMDAKAKRRLMFTSFTVLIDNAGNVTRLHINERGGNYSQYDFSACQPNASINSKMFTAKAL